MNAPLNFDNLYAAFKLLDRDGSVYVGTELLHFVPGEVTRDWYVPYCELLAAFGLDDPRPKDPHLGFYVQHATPRDAVGSVFKPGVVNGRGFVSTKRDERLQRFKLSAHYKALMENVQQLQQYEALSRLSDPTDGNYNAAKLRALMSNPFVKQWRRP